DLPRRPRAGGSAATAGTAAVAGTAWGTGAGTSRIVAGASGSGSTGAGSGAAMAGATGRTVHSRNNRRARERAWVAAGVRRARASVVTRSLRKKDRGKMLASRRVDVHKKLKSRESFQ